jgi:hypothetical protein
LISAVRPRHAAAGADGDCRHPLPADIGKAVLLELAHCRDALTVDVHGNPRV